MDALKQHTLTLNKSETVSFVHEISILRYRIDYRKTSLDPDRLQLLLKLPVPHEPKTWNEPLFFACYAKWIANVTAKIHHFSNSKSFR